MQTSTQWPLNTTEWSMWNEAREPRGSTKQLFSEVDLSGGVVREQLIFRRTLHCHRHSLEGSKIPTRCSNKQRYHYNYCLHGLNGLRFPTMIWPPVSATLAPWSPIRVCSLRLHHTVSMNEKIIFRMTMQYPI